MYFRTAYTRRQEKSTRRQKRLGTLAVFGVTAGVTALLVPELVGAAHDDAHIGGSAGLALAAAPAPALAAAAPQQAAAPRRVYPYSIIPGGVSGAAELKRVIRADKVVAAHYAGFDADKAQEVIVTRPRAVYVSYRKGDQVFWTAKKLMLAQGETLLSDGANEMRARCANRISDVPRFPVEAHGPSEEELDTVLAGADGEEGMFLAASAGSLPEEAGSGSRYPLGYFPDGAGLVQPAASLASRRSEMPSVPHADHSALYGTSHRVGGNAQSSASEGDAGATPSAGASSGGATGSGSGDITQTPGGGNTPGAGDPSTAPGGGNPATPGDGAGNGGTGGDGGAGGPVTGGNGGGNGGTGAGGTGNGSGNGGSSGGGTGPGNQPSTPTPGAGPELPPQGPAIPGTPQPSAPGDVELPATPVDVPEPGTLWLSGAAVAAMLWLRRKGTGARH